MNHENISLKVALELAESLKAKAALINLSLKEYKYYYPVVKKASEKIEKFIEVSNLDAGERIEIDTKRAVDQSGNSNNVVRETIKKDITNMESMIKLFLLEEGLNESFQTEVITNSNKPLTLSLNLIYNPSNKEETIENESKV